MSFDNFKIMLEREKLPIGSMDFFFLSFMGSM